MSRASEWAARWQDVAARHPGEFSSATELAEIGPPLEWCPAGCNWAARVTPKGTLVLALPEVNGQGGRFRPLTAEEITALNAWILDVFGTATPPMEQMWDRIDPRRWDGAGA